MKKIYLILIVIFVAAGVTLAFKGNFLALKNIGKTEIPNNPVICTMEAKQCPDGSYVGRTGPACEFPTCPTVTMPTPKQGSITGTVTLGPTCPVERMPPDPNCAPKPYSTYINIMKFGSANIVKTIKSGDNGAFSVNLDSGVYVLKAQGGNVLPRCGEVTVEVKSGQYTKTQVSCDSGIR